jgi:hypothetical protein
MGCLGFEPRTYRLKAEYSTIELAAHPSYYKINIYLKIIKKIKLINFFNLVLYNVSSLQISKHIILKKINLIKKFMINLQIIGQLISSTLIILSGPIIILLLAIKKN